MPPVPVRETTGNRQQRLHDNACELLSSKSILMQEKRSLQEYVDQELQQQRDRRADAALGPLSPRKVPRTGPRCEKCEALHQTDAFVRLKRELQS